MSNFRALAEKTVVELFDMVKEKVAEIERKQAEIDLLKRLIEIKDRVRDEQQAKIDDLQKRVDETLTWLTRTDIRAINMAREILQGGDLKNLRGAND